MKQLSIVFFLLFSLCLSAQDIEVKKFGPNEKDQTAALSKRKDINGVVCGLVKIQLKEPGAEFEGNVMGDVQFTGSEYLVWLPNGTKRMGIKHPDYLPTTIVFADYGTKMIESGVTYQMKLNANKKPVKVDKSKKGMAVFNIKPSNAMLLIDGQIADGSGGTYTLSLPYGTHYYTVRIKDFSLNNQVVYVDKNGKTINVDLTEFFATMRITCETKDANIAINGEQKGVGEWNGMLAPGRYTLDVSKDGCHSQLRQIELKDNDTQTVAFTKLKTITGSLWVDYKPTGSDVLLNGKKVGETPLVLNELPCGDYQLEIWKEYYVKEGYTIHIVEDHEWKEKGELKPTAFGELVAKAENGDEASLAEYYWYGFACGYKGMHITCEEDTFYVPFNPVKAISLYKKLYDWDNAEHFDSCYSASATDEELSFCRAKEEVEEVGTMTLHLPITVFCGNPYPTLAWHYFYGIGCDKNVEEAKRLMRLYCTVDGLYPLPSLIEFVKDIGMDSELKYKKYNSGDYY